MITPVILSGGSGTRLWPMSRPERPKQLLPLTGAETMLQLTARRAADRTRFTAPLIVAGSAHEAEIAVQLAATGAGDATLILEPAGRNTAPAIALAALVAAPDALLLVMPSDHLIPDLQAFYAVIEAGLPLARDGWLVTLGWLHRAGDRLGYIERGSAYWPSASSAQRASSKSPIARRRKGIWRQDVSCGTAESSCSPRPPCSTRLPPTPRSSDERQGGDRRRRA
jgi:mannose-1-phosphate guanylyltransferase/mannose-1-phosphate guanylyltransferase/mannose-6-phosphate isomerase